MELGGRCRYLHAPPLYTQCDAIIRTPHLLACRTVALLYTQGDACLHAPSLYFQGDVLYSRRLTLHAGL